MAKVFIDGLNLMVQLQGIRKFGAIKKGFEIPLSDVVSAEGRDISWNEIPRVWQKRSGTNAPWYFGGTFRQNGERVFYDLKRSERALVISLKNSKYSRLIIGTENAEELARELSK